MFATSNFNFQNKNFSEVKPHINRVKSKTKNKNIAWKYAKYDILNQHPYDYNALVQQDWGEYVRRHDKRNRHKSQKYGTVKGFFRKRKKHPYRTVVMGFASGAVRRKYHRKIHDAYPDVKLGNVLHVEAKGVDNAVKEFNRTSTHFLLTDYAVHPDEIGLHCGQVHAHARCYYHGTTKKSGKPSLNINNAIRQELEAQGIKSEKNTNPSRLSAFRLFTDKITYRNVSQALEQAFPNAHLDFHFVRTDARSVSHDRWQRKQDLKHALQHSSEAYQLKLRTMSASASIARSASQLGGSLSQQVAKVKANLASTSEYLSHGSSVASSADELVPRYKHHYSQSAQNSASVATSSEQVRLHQSASNHAQSVADSMASNNAQAIARITSKSNEASSKAHSLEVSALSLAPSLSVSAESYGNSLGSSYSNSASVEVAHGYASANDVVNSYYNSYNNAYVIYTSSAGSSYSVSAKNYVSSTISSERGQLSQSVSNHVQSVDKSMADMNTQSIAYITSMSNEASSEANSLEVSASSLAPSLSASAESYGRSMGSSYSGSALVKVANASLVASSTVDSYSIDASNARTSASQSASLSASMTVAGKTSQLSQKSAQIDRAGSAIHDINARTDVDDGQKHWSFGSAVKAFLHTTVTKVQQTIKKCQTKWDNAVEKSKEADRKLKEAQRDTVAVHDYHYLLNIYDPATNGKRKYGGNLFKALLGRYDHATSKLQKRFVRDDVKNMAKDQTNPEHIKQIRKVVKADRQAKHSMPTMTKQATSSTNSSAQQASTSPATSSSASSSSSERPQQEPARTNDDTSQSTSPTSSSAQQSKRPNASSASSSSYNPYKDPNNPLSPLYDGGSEL